jgi:hypothetical protein
MTVSFKAPVKSAVVNNAFVSKQADDIKVGKLGLNKLSEGSQIFSIQKSLNELFDVSGTGEGDPNSKNYNNENYITNGDNQKVAIEKLDANLKATSDIVDLHINSTIAHLAENIEYDPTDSGLAAINVQDAIDEVEDRVDIVESDVQNIEDSIGAVNGICPLNGSAKIDAIYLPSYVDDVLEYADLASFPITGETGKIYVALDTELIYRWTGSIYIEISKSKVDSVNGQTGIVVLDADNISETATRYWSKKNTVTNIAPLPTNDSSENYSAGSFWYDNVLNALYICESATIGAAVWNKVIQSPLVELKNSNFSAFNGYVYLTTGVIDVQLPNPVSGDKIIVKKTDSSNVSLLQYGSEQIEGVASSYILTSDKEACTLISDGFNWYRI